MKFLLLLFWLVCAFITFGGSYAEQQQSYPSLAKKNRRRDAGFALVFALLGPFGLLVIYPMSGFFEHGWYLPGSAKDKRLTQ